MEPKEELFGLINEIMTTARLLITNNSGEAVKGYIDALKLNVDHSVIRDMTTSAFWSSTRSKVYFMKSDNRLSDYSIKDASKFLPQTFGNIFERAEVIALAQEHGNASDEEAMKITNAVIGMAWNKVLDFIKYYNAQNNIEMYVDMFADAGRVEILDESVLVVYPHVLFQVALKDYRKDIVADYKTHFGNLDEILDFIIASRFARDKKRSYLWLHCTSDWGKGFFTSLLGQNHRMVEEISVKEVEKIFEGGPVGKSMADFKRAFVLVVDEFKSARSVMKQLQNTITLSPKNQLWQKVHVYLKLFMSAEDVPSFASDEGIEDQFANRFNYIKCVGTLTGRALFQDVGKAVYFDHCEAYITEYINEAIAEYVVMRKAGAEDEANFVIDDFWVKHNIGKRFVSFNSGLPAFAEGFTDWLVENRCRVYCKEKQASSFGCGDSVFTPTNHDAPFFNNVVLVQDKWFLKSGSLMVTNWLGETRDKSVKGSLGFKRSAIVKACTENTLDGKPIVIREGARVHKGYFLVVTEEQHAELMEHVPVTLGSAREKETTSGVSPFKDAGLPSIK